MLHGTQIPETDVTMARGLGLWFLTPLACRNIVLSGIGAHLEAGDTPALVPPQEVPRCGAFPHLNGASRISRLIPDLGAEPLRPGSSTPTKPPQTFRIPDQSTKSSTMTA